MSDCANIEMRELLPDLLHEELSATRRAAVTAHVAGCPACEEELALLREAQATLRATPIPRVNVAAIVAALPAPPRTAVHTSALHDAKGGGRPRVVTTWRVAAAVAAISVGAWSLAVVRRAESPPSVASSDSARASGNDSLGTVTMPRETTLALATPGTEGTTSRGTPVASGLSTAGGIGDLDDSTLEALLGDLDRLEAAPTEEPEALSGSRLVGGATGTEE